MHTVEESVTTLSGQMESLSSETENTSRVAEHITESSRNQLATYEETLGVTEAMDAQMSQIVTRLSEITQEFTNLESVAKDGKQDVTSITEIIQALTEMGQDIWVDWEDIPAGSAWMDQIKQGTKPILFVGAAVHDFVNHDLEQYVPIVFQPRLVTRQPVLGAEALGVLGAAHHPEGHRIDRPLESFHQFAVGPLVAFPTSPDDARIVVIHTGAFSRAYGRPRGKVSWRGTIGRGPNPVKTRPSKGGAGRFARFRGGRAVLEAGVAGRRQLDRPRVARIRAQPPDPREQRRHPHQEGRHDPRQRGVEVAEPRPAALVARQIATIAAQKHADVNFVLLPFESPEESLDPLVLAVPVEHELPFGVGEAPTETGYSVGLGRQFSGGRGRLDLGLERL